MLFYFSCVMTCLSLTLCKKALKPLPKKLFQCPGWMRKNFIPRNFSWRVVARGNEMQVASKIYWKNNRVFQILAPIATEKDILSELNRCIFQISLIPKILFILVLCRSVFYSKITWPPPPTKIKISDHPLWQRLFWNFSP